MCIYNFLSIHYCSLPKTSVSPHLDLWVSHCLFFAWCFITLHPVLPEGTHLKPKDIHSQIRWTPFYRMPSCRALTQVCNISLRCLPSTLSAALCRFIPRHADELELDVDDPLYVEEEEDDYWYRGYNMRTGERGIFPAFYAHEVIGQTKELMSKSREMILCQHERQKSPMFMRLYQHCTLQAWKEIQHGLRLSAFSF